MSNKKAVDNVKVTHLMSSKYDATATIMRFWPLNLIVRL